MFLSDSSPISTTVQEIAGVVPDGLINTLLGTVGVDPAGGFLGSAFRGSFSDVRDAVRRVRREGWSAGTVLTQVRSVANVPLCAIADSHLSSPDARPHHPPPTHPCQAQEQSRTGHGRVRQGAVRGRGGGASAARLLSQDQGGDAGVSVAWETSRRNWAANDMILWPKMSSPCPTEERSQPE